MTFLMNGPGVVAAGARAEVIVVLELVVAPGVRGVVFPVEGRESVAAAAHDRCVVRARRAAVVHAVDIGRDRLGSLRRLDRERDVDLPRTARFDGGAHVGYGPAVVARRGVRRRVDDGAVGSHRLRVLARARGAVVAARRVRAAASAPTPAPAIARGMVAPASQRCHDEQSGAGQKGALWSHDCDDTRPALPSRMRRTRPQTMRRTESHLSVPTNPHSDGISPARASRRIAPRKRTCAPMSRALVGSSKRRVCTRAPLARSGG